MVNEQVTTVNLTEGEITTVEFSTAYPFYWITNMSDGDIYVSRNAPEAYSDGTYTVAAGERHRISGGVSDKKINLLGNGRVQIEACAIAALPSFKAARKGGDDTLDIPYKDGIIHEYDYRKIAGINPMEWIDITGGMNFSLSNAVLNTDENCLEFQSSKNSYGILAETEPDEWTAYFVFRCKDCSTKSGGYHYICLSASYGSNSYQKAEFTVSRNSDFLYCFVGFDGNIESKTKANTNFCVVTVTRTASNATLYINGIKIDTVKSSAYRAEKWMIFDRKNNGESAGTTANSDGGILQTKYLAIANTIHTDQQICENSKWILAKYLK